MPVELQLLPGRTWLEPGGRPELLEHTLLELVEQQQRQEQPSLELAGTWLVPGEQPQPLEHTCLGLGGT